MGKLVVSLDNVVVKEAPLLKDRVTVGRRPYNDIVIDNLAVSGEHAVLHSVGGDVFIEDLNSTNGTYINGKAVKKQLLTPNDLIEIGKYRIRYMAESLDYERTMILRPNGGANHATAPPNPPMAPLLPASIKVLNGGAAGREVVLNKAVTTIGKPGTQVASIAKRPMGYVLAHVEGPVRPKVNGQDVADGVTPLKNGDLIELAGTRMQFIQC